MILYMDRSDFVENESGYADVRRVSDEVFRYILSAAQKKAKRYATLQKIYDNDAEKQLKRNEVSCNYAKYIVDSLQGYYLGDPVTYMANEETSRPLRMGSVRARLHKGELVRANESEKKSTVDISVLQDCYDRQTISAVDSDLGRDMGIFGESCELLYASDDAKPVPKSAVIYPGSAVLIQDNSVAHRPLMGMVWEKIERADHTKFFRVSIYNNQESVTYLSHDLQNFRFFPEGDPTPHYFSRIPLIVYKNNSRLSGDFEGVISLIEGRNRLLTNRLEDKERFVNSILAIFGATVGDPKMMGEERFLDGIPTDARIEYVQKVFDEASMDVLDRTLVKEIHKQSMTVDMSDENFAGNQSGQAIKMKLLIMNMAVKNKIRQMERGLKRRFVLYNAWLAAAGRMDPVDVTDIEPVFSIAIPIDESAIVDMVVKLQDIVDDETLLSQLWFVSDPREVIEAVRKQKKEKASLYLAPFSAGEGEEKNTAFLTEDSDAVRKDQ